MPTPARLGRACGIRGAAGVVAVSRAELDPENLLAAANGALGRPRVTVINRSGRAVAGLEPDWLDPARLAEARASDVTAPLGRPGAWLWPVQRSVRAVELDLVVDVGGTLSDSWLDDAAPVLAMLAARLALWALGEAVEVESRARQQTELLTAVLATTGDDPGPEQVQALARHGWDTAGEHLGFHLRVPSTVDDHAPHPVEVRERLLTSLRGSGYDGPLVAWGGWITAAKLGRDLRQALENAVDAVVADQSLDVVAGFGTAEAGLAGWRRTVSGARRAAQQRARTDPADLDPTSVDDTRSVAMAGELATVDEVLVSTLRSWLGTGSRRATADRLGVHRNTVGSRLAKLSQQLEIDLRDPAIRMALTLAVRRLDRDSAES